MENSSDLQVALFDIVQILKKLNISYHITGGLVSSLYGEPRFTQDIDIVIGIDLQINISSLAAELDNLFYINDESVAKAFEIRKMFQAIHKETLLKIDFHIGEMIPGELSRSKILELFPQIITPVVSLEDSILSKLLWIKNGSHKSRQDVLMMLKLNTKIDNSYLESQSKKMNILDILEEIKSEI